MPSRRRLRRTSVLIALTPFLGACDSSEASLPTAASHTSRGVGTGAGVSDARPVGFPPLTGPGRVFGFKELLRGWEGYDGWEGTLATRYVLYDDGRFALAYAQLGIEFGGTYTERDALVALRWDANSSVPPNHPYPDRWPGPWEATATLTGGTLRVTYPIRMWLDGFLDAAYELEP